MAHTKQGGKTRQHKQRPGNRLGIKLFGGETAKTGMILVRQRGTKIKPGDNVKKGKDDTLYAQIPGKVKFYQKKIRRFDGRLKLAKFVTIDQQ